MFYYHLKSFVSKNNNYLHCLCRCMVHGHIDESCTENSRQNIDGVSCYGVPFVHCKKKQEHHFEELKSKYNFNPKIIWSCQWLKLKKQVWTIKDYVINTKTEFIPKLEVEDFFENRYPKIPPKQLNIRDAVSLKYNAHIFFKKKYFLSFLQIRGGRVEQFCTLWDKESNPSSTLSYRDINSLYPSICLHQKFGCGPYEHLVDQNKIQKTFNYNEEKYEFQDENGNTLYGLVTCRVGIARENAHHFKQNIAILPHKIKIDSTEMTFYPMCGSCLKLQSKKSCIHNNFERSWVDTYDLIEL